MLALSDEHYYAAPWVTLFERAISSTIEGENLLVVEPMLGLQGTRWLTCPVGNQDEVEKAWLGGEAKSFWGGLGGSNERISFTPYGKGRLIGREPISLLSQLRQVSPRRCKEKYARGTWVGKTRPTWGETYHDRDTRQNVPEVCESGKLDPHEGIPDVVVSNKLNVTLRTPLTRALKHALRG